MELTSNKRLIVRVRSLMTANQVYKDAHLKLNTLAGRLGISSGTLSKAINGVTGKSFNDYVNEFRIKEAVRLLSEAPENMRFVHGFYKQVGFHNRASFYRTFKRMLGATPAEYKRSRKVQTADSKPIPAPEWRSN